MNWHSEEYTSFTLEVILKLKQWDDRTADENIRQLDQIADLIKQLIPSKVTEFHSQSRPRFAVMSYGVVLPYQVSRLLSSLQDTVSKLATNHPTPHR